MFKRQWSTENKATSSFVKHVFVSIYTCSCICLCMFSLHTRLWGAKVAKAHTRTHGALTYSHAMAATITRYIR